MKTNKDLAIEYLQMVVAGDLDTAFEKYIDMTGKHHNAFTPAGFPALKQAMKEAHLQFPRKQFAIQHILSEENFVVVHSQLVLEKGRTAMPVVHIFRFNDGKIVEMWDIGQVIEDDSVNADGVF